MSRAGMKRKMSMRCFQALQIRKGIKKQFKGRCGYCGVFGHKAANCPNNKSNQKMGPKGKPEKRRCKKLKRTINKRVRLICQKYDATIAVNWDILHGTAQSPMRMLIFLEKMSKTGNSPK